MLQSLHVKNLALIEESEVEFGRGLNILTGETGAGKSLLLGSINLALGGKFEKEMLRNGADSALVELIFTADDEKVCETLRGMDLEAEDGLVVISRKLQAARSICRVNGETVSAKQVKELAEVLLDVHGQHEHQSLLHKKKHLEILDAFSGKEYQVLSEKVREAYAHWRKLSKEIEEHTLDEEGRKRERALAEFEWNEIQNAALKVGEDEELEARYRIMENARKITDALSESYLYTGADAEAGAGGNISRALRILRQVSNFDERLAGMESELAEIENLLSDYNREISEYMDSLDFDASDFTEVEDRLNELNRLKDKYGRTIEACIAYGKQKEQDLEKLADYDAYMTKLHEEANAARKELENACEKLSALRRENAKILEARLVEAIAALNFLAVRFEIEVRRTEEVSANGWDDVEFMISTNPGEPLRPLRQVASGGELSRIMLAIKTVLAGADEIDTLIFDEIDAGISGKTAWKVAEQLDTVGKEHQVICITHLPQIAAMADQHFCIEKSAMDEATITEIRALDASEAENEVARLVGSDSLTQAALENAKEMRRQALAFKQGKEIL